MRQRPFEILGLQQIAVGASSKEPLRRLWVDMLGLTPGGYFVSEQENVDEDIVLIGCAPFQVEVDLMQPLDPARTPCVDQPSLNHVGLWVDQLAAAVTWLTAHGVRFAPGGIHKGASGHDLIFLHPEGNEEFPIGGAGVLIALVQAPETVSEAYRTIAAASY
jgi:lactoylglutathione lyase